MFADRPSFAERLARMRPGSPAAGIAERVGALPGSPGRRTGDDLWRVCGLIAGIVVVLALVGTVAFTTLLYRPFAAREPAPPLQTAMLYDRAGALLARLEPVEDRVVVPLRVVPSVVRQAFIAAEDKRFYRHPGVDGAGTARAALAIAGGGALQGGSTITQQVVKNLYVGRDRTLARKLREGILALRLERRLSKDQILERYLNQIYLGHGAYGVEAGARTYFGRPVGQLGLAEAATLASVVSAPARYDPFLDTPSAIERRNRVIEHMVRLGMVPEREAGQAAQAPLGLVRREPAAIRFPYFVDYVVRDILDRQGKDTLYRTGLRVRTTIDPVLQEAAERAVKRVLNRPGDPAASLVALDVDTGGVLAMVGGRDWRRSQVNLATGQGGAGRQAGSAFKVFTLTAALMDGISPDRVYAGPGTLSLPGWTVSNYDGASFGSMSLRSATVHSVNTVFARLILEVGPRRVARVARAMGIRSPLEPTGPLTLGSSSVTPLEMTAAFATLASGGTYRRPTGIARMTDGEGNVLEEARGDGRRVVPSWVASEVTTILQEAVAAGTGTRARLPGVAVAGKTGTANEHTDAWFCGYVSRVAACVWVGHPRGLVTMENVHGIEVTGGSFPAEIWRTFMLRVPGLVPAPPRRDASGLPSGGSGAGHDSSGSTGDAPAQEAGGEAPGALDPPADRPTSRPPREDEGLLCRLVRC